jgi:hypothetical protein
MVFDPANEIYGRCIAGKVLIFPAVKGSAIDSYVICQLKKSGLEPVAIINSSSFRLPQQPIHLDIPETPFRAYNTPPIWD